MPSIFVWKATTPNPSKTYLRCYSGSNWVVEDSDTSSRSYKYLQQIVIPGSNNDSVITFLAKTMPQNWVGSELLEVHHVPYHLIQSDAYATLEHIGYWMRVTVNKELPVFAQEELQAEWNTIQEWMKPRPAPSRSPIRLPGPPIVPPSISVGAPHTLDPQQVRQNFQEFYAKIASPHGSIAHPVGRHTRRPDPRPKRAPRH